MGWLQDIKDKAEKHGKEVAVAGIAITALAVSHVEKTDILSYVSPVNAVKIAIAQDVNGFYGRINEGKQFAKDRAVDLFRVYALSRIETKHEAVQFNETVKQLEGHELSHQAMNAILKMGQIMPDSVDKANLKASLEETFKENGATFDKPVKNVMLGIRNSYEGNNLIAEYYRTVINDEARLDLYRINQNDANSPVVGLTTINKDGKTSYVLSQWTSEESQRIGYIENRAMPEGKFFSLEGGRNGVDIIRLDINGLGMLPFGDGVTSWKEAEAIQHQYQKDGNMLLAVSKIDPALGLDILDAKNNVMVSVNDNNVTVAQQKDGVLHLKTIEDSAFTKVQDMLPDASPIKAVVIANERATEWMTFMLPDKDGNQQFASVLANGKTVIRELNGSNVINIKQVLTKEFEKSPEFKDKVRIPVFYKQKKQGKDAQYKVPLPEFKDNDKGNKGMSI